MLEATREILPPACERRPFLVIGSCPAYLTEALAQAGGHVMQFLCAEDALLWLDEETPRAALVVSPLEPALVEELFARAVPMVACATPDRNEARRLAQAMRILGR